MLRKIFNGFSVLCVLSGFILILGTAGSSDLNLIDWYELLTHSVIALLLISVGLTGFYLSDKLYINN